ncbi:MAG: ATP-grasp domain-containing protein [Proteobacteria bacterium]|nr:ATP-grasp domain-containing protein [Pseudomonadota bacterium]
MPTLFFTPRYTEDSQALWKAAASLGWKTERLTSWRVPDHLKAVEDPVIYGEAMFAPALAEQLGRVLRNPPDDWLVRLPYEYKQRNIRMTTLGEARIATEPAFVKPPNDKSFPADVYRGSELPAEFEDTMTVLVSEVVRWEREFRCFILDRQLQTFSIYSRHGELQRDQKFASEPCEDEEVRAFVCKMLADQRVELPTTTVIDVGTIQGKGWACVEQNAAWGAGIYGCDPAAVLRVLQRTSSDADPSHQPTCYTAQARGAKAQ